MKKAIPAVNSLQMRQLFLCMMAIVFASCSKEIVNTKDYDYEIPANISDGIAVRDIKSYNIDSNLISRLNRDIIDESIYNVHSVLIYKDSALFYEKYLCGKDEKHGKNLGIVHHDIYTLHDTRSISKSVVSACIGIAISKGIIKDENVPIKKYFSCSDNDKEGNITIKDLLTMTSGLCWKEIGNYNGMSDETKMDLSLNPIAFVLNKDLVAEPGSTWNYSAGNTQLLAEIIQKVSGKNICQFAEENLFRPLGITNKEWVDLTIKKIPAAASGLRLTSRELLKLGILYKDNGVFNSARIVDSNWVKASFSDHIQRPDLTGLNLENGAYGYQFWTYHFNIKNKSINITEAKGNGGQSVFICKELNLVVVITAGNYGKLQHNSIPYKILKDYVLNSIV
ncbi:MAG: beta-lactamase [Segetibacter sp.]|nr:beta-lactamase [Segetibacter sp.]